MEPGTHKRTVHCIVIDEEIKAKRGHKLNRASVEYRDELNTSFWFLNISSYLQASFSLRMAFINKREETTPLSHMHDRHHSAA